MCRELRAQRHGGLRRCVCPGASRDLWRAVCLGHRERESVRWWGVSMGCTNVGLGKVVKGSAWCSEEGILWGEGPQRAVCLEWGLQRAVCHGGAAWRVRAWGYAPRRDSARSRGSPLSRGGAAWRSKQSKMLFVPPLPVGWSSAGAAPAHLSCCYGRLCLLSSHARGGELSSPALLRSAVAWGGTGMDWVSQGRLGEPPKYPAAWDVAGSTGGTVTFGPSW